MGLTQDGLGTPGESPLQCRRPAHWNISDAMAPQARVPNQMPPKLAGQGTSAPSSATIRMKRIFMTPPDSGQCSMVAREAVDGRREAAAAAPTDFRYRGALLLLLEPRSCSGVRQELIRGSGQTRSRVARTYLKSPLLGMTTQRPEPTECSWARTSLPPGTEAWWHDQDWPRTGYQASIQVDVSEARICLMSP